MASPRTASHGLIVLFVAAAALGCGNETDATGQPDSQPMHDAQAVAERVPGPPGGEWITVQELDGQVSLQMPGSPQKQTASSQTAKGLVELVMYKVPYQNLFWNFAVSAYPQAVIDEHAERGTLFAMLADGNLLQKPGGRIVDFRELEDAPVPGVDYRIDYPSGRNSGGFQYAAGFARHRQYLLGTRVCWLFVDVNDEVYRADPDGVDALIDRFFGSLRIQPAPLESTN